MSSSSNRPVAVFDLDGTLTDPKPGITGSVQYALERLGRPVPSQDELTWVIGPPLQASFAELLGDQDLAVEGVRLYRERFSVTGLFENAVYPGIPACLDALREAGITLYVATSKPRVFAERIVDHFALRPYFDTVYGSELDGLRVDKRDLLAFVVADAGIAPERAVMIGDREHDALGAAAVGMATIGVSWGYGLAGELARAGVREVVEHPDALAPAILSRLKPGPSGPR